MKKTIFFLLLTSLFASAAQAQSLKDLLYSGKLKKDSNIVIRKGEDLSSRIDTGGNKLPEADSLKIVAVLTDSGTGLVRQAVPVGTAAGDTASANSTVNESGGDTATPAVAATDNASAAKSNNRILKEYMDALSASLKSEVLTSKKIKKGTYYLMLEYEIGTDGQVNALNVVSTPENAFLQGQVKERMLLEAPQLAPVMDSTGKPRKVKRKYNFNVTKD